VVVAVGMFLSGVAGVTALLPNGVVLQGLGDCLVQLFFAEAGCMPPVLLFYPLGRRRRVNTALLEEAYWRR